MRYSVLLLLTLCSCGSNDTLSRDTLLRPHGNYAGFETYVNSFIEEGLARNRAIDANGLTIVFVSSFPTPLSTTAVGYCLGESNTVEILSSYWDNSDALQRENLIFHELGHCLLGLEHITCPNVMCPHMLNEIDYLSNRTAYLDVLFSSK